MKVKQLRKLIYENIHCLKKYGVDHWHDYEVIVEKDKNGHHYDVEVLKSIYRLIQDTKKKHNDRKEVIELESDEDDDADDEDVIWDGTTIKTENNDDAKVSAVSVPLQHSKSQNGMDGTNEKRSDPSTSRNGHTHRSSVHPPLQELSTNVNIPTSGESFSSNRAFSAPKRRVSFCGDRQSQSITLQNSDEGDEISSSDEGISSVSTIDFEEQHTALELTAPAHFNDNIPSQSTSAAVSAEKLTPITKTTEERLPNRLPYPTNTSNNGINNSLVARKTSPILPVISPASSRTNQFNSANSISSGNTRASTAVHQKTVSHLHNTTATRPIGNYSTTNSSRNPSFATSVINPSMNRPEQISTIVPLMQSTNHRKSHQQTTQDFGGSLSRTRNVSAAATLTTNKKHPTVATANRLTESGTTSNELPKQTNALDSMKRPQLVDYDSSSCSSNSSRSSNGSKSRDIDGKNHKYRTTTSVPQKSKSPPSEAKKKEKHCDFSKDNRSKRSDAKPSTSQRNEGKPSKSKRDDDGPSTSKRHSNDSAHSSKCEIDNKALKVIQYIGKVYNKPITEPTVRDKLCHQLVDVFKTWDELTTEPNSTPVEPLSRKISPSKGEKLNRKRFHDPATKQIARCRELDDLNDPHSMYFEANLPPKRRRKSTHGRLNLDDVLDDDLDDSEPSFMSSTRAARNRPFENGDPGLSIRSHSTNAMEDDANNLLTPMFRRGENRAGKNIDARVFYEDPYWRAHCAVCKRRSSDKLITAHYVQFHPGLEVYTSRLSPEYAERARNEPSMPRLENTTKGAKMRAQCYFCDKEMVFDAKYWPQHILSHTGEYAHECLVCKRKVSALANHRRRFSEHEIAKVFDYTFVDNYLWAYMCKFCHYVQKHEENMRKHLKKEHEYGDQDLRDCYDHIRLLSNRMCEPMTDVKEEIPDENDYDEDSDQYEYYDSDPEDGSDDEPPTAARTISQSVKINTLNIKNEHTCCVDEDVNIGYAQLNETNEELPNPICDGPTEEAGAILAPEPNPVEMQEPSTVEIRRIKVERMDAALEMVQTAADRSRDINRRIQQMNKKTEFNYLRLEQCYMVNDPKMTVRLTPWLNDDVLGGEKQLRPVTLYALYKCMAANCIYSTNDKVAMMDHLTEHEILVALVLRKNPYCNLSARRRSGWLKCAYCVYTAKSSSDIVRHFEEEHGNCAFQCSLCFYRTIEIANVVRHMDKCHPLDLTAQILVCNRELKSLDHERVDMERNRKKYFPPYVVRTDEGTERKFYVKEHFEECLNATTVAYYDCNRCTLPGISKLNASQHLSCHGLDEYHCLHCPHGAKLDNMLDHMHERHPSKLLYLSSRKFYKTDSRKDDVEATVIVDMGNKVTMPNNLRFEVCPYTETQLNFMSPALKSIVSNQKDPPGEKHIVNIDVKDMSRAYRLKESHGSFLTLEDFRELEMTAK